MARAGKQRQAGKAAPRNKATDARGLGKLAVDATVGITNIVETLHHNIARVRAPLGVPVEAPMGGIPGLAYRAVRGATRAIGGGIDVTLAALAPWLAQEASSARREALVSALNGMLGDHLAASANPLAIPMQFRRAGAGLALTREALGAAFPQAGPRVLVLVHGLCFSDLQWRRKGHDHGERLVQEAGTTRPMSALYLHYNTGAHVSTNGRAFADALESLVRAWPVEIAQLTIVGHSMGGLVARSACAHATLAGHAWLRRLRTLVFLGTPHAGAPLERGGNWVNLVLDASPYTAAFARLARVRSAGITDLRHGSLLDADWRGEDRFRHVRHATQSRAPVALPEGVACFALAASIARRSGEIKERLVGDGLVPLASALGHGAGPGGANLFAPANERIAYGVNHLGLLDAQLVYRQLARWTLGSGAVSAKAS